MNDKAPEGKRFLKYLPDWILNCGLLEEMKTFLNNAENFKTTRIPSRAVLNRPSVSSSFNSQFPT